LHNGWTLGEVESGVTKLRFDQGRARRRAAVAFAKSDAVKAAEMNDGAILVNGAGNHALAAQDIGSAKSLRQNIKVLHAVEQG